MYTFFWKCKTVLSFVTYHKFRIYLFFLLLRYHNIMFPLFSNSIFRNVNAWDLQVCTFISVTNLRLFRRGWCLYLTVTQSEFFAFIFVIIYSNFAGRQKEEKKIPSSSCRKMEIITADDLNLARIGAAGRWREKMCATIVCRWVVL